MQNTDAFERNWHDRRVGHPLHREMTFTHVGVALGRGTILAEFEKKGRAARGLVFDGEEARLLSLLAAAYREPLAGGRAGEKALAQIHLAFLGLPKIDEADAYRLFLAGTALEKGVSPSDLMKALGFARAASYLEKYWEDQPRVPAGSGRESGEWTSGDGAGPQYAQASEPPPSIRRLHPDVTYETDRKAKRSLDYWRQKSTEEIIQSLEPRVGNQEALTVKPDGTVVQGNTRIKVLEERGVDVNSLPRAPFDDSIDMFLPQISTPGGGGGSLKDKKYPIQE